MRWFFYNLVRPQMSTIANASAREELEATLRLTTYLATFVLPLFIRNSGKRLAPFGSGFLVSARDAFFLISAAHVLDEVERLHFYVAPSATRALSGRLLKTKLPSDGRRTSDKADVGILKLEGPSLPPYPQVFKQAVPVARFRLRSCVPTLCHARTSNIS